jgi:hypothetical protein
LANPDCNVPLLNGLPRLGKIAAVLSAGYSLGQKMAAVAIFFKLIGLFRGRRCGGFAGQTQMPGTSSMHGGGEYIISWHIRELSRLI